MRSLRVHLDMLGSTFLYGRISDRKTTTSFEGQRTRDDDHIASDLLNIHENDQEIKPDVYVSKTPHVEGFPKSFKKNWRDNSWT